MSSPRSTRRCHWRVDDSPAFGRRGPRWDLLGAGVFGGRCRRTSVPPPGMASTRSVPPAAFGRPAPFPGGDTLGRIVGRADEGSRRPAGRAWGLVGHPISPDCRHRSNSIRACALVSGRSLQVWKHRRSYAFLARCGLHPGLTRMRAGTLSWMDKLPASELLGNHAVSDFSLRGRESRRRRSSLDMPVPRTANTRSE